MKKNIIVSIMVILMAGAMITGATYAWFTDSADPIVNEFTAGTVEISAEETVFPAQFMVENWNPGDCAEKEYTIINTGTKGVYIRAVITGSWFEPDGVTPFVPDPDEDVVTWDLQDAGNAADWTMVGDTLYYNEPVDGSYTEADEAARTIKLALKVCLDGAGTGNQYQGKVFKLTAQFEAVQKSNGAVDDVWPSNPY